MAEKDNQLTEDARFVLGEISATVRAIPEELREFKAEVRAALASHSKRLADVELAQAQRVGARGLLVWLVGIFAATCSGLMTYFIGGVSKGPH